MPRTERKINLESLAIKAKNGDSGVFDQIIKELETDIKKLVSKYYIPGGDSEDTLQEARIGVWKAVEDWDVNGGMSFKNFAISICCKRHIITAMSAGNRKKYDLLNSAVSLSLPVTSGDDDNEQSLADFLPDAGLSPEEQCIVQEEYALYSGKIASKLTLLEKMVFGEYMRGLTYSEIACALNIKTKAVDNALMRIRNKASSLWPGIEKK